jgi:hypothetical protein
MGSIVVFTFMVVDLVWGNIWLPRTVELAAASIIVIAWLFMVSSIARRQNAPLRFKVIAWLLVAAFIGLCVFRAFEGYYFIHELWAQWVVLGVAGLLFFASAIALAILLSPKPPSSNAVTPYTVESEAPDHVLHVSSTPNYSFKRTGAGRLR